MSKSQMSFEADGTREVGSAVSIDEQAQAQARFNDPEEAVLADALASIGRVFAKLWDQMVEGIRTMNPLARYMTRTAAVSLSVVGAFFTAMTLLFSVSDLENSFIVHVVAGVVLIGGLAAPLFIALPFDQARERDRKALQANMRS